MHNSPKELIKKRLADLEKRINSDITREAKIALAVNIPVEITKDISKLIQEDYALINKTARSLNPKDKDYADKRLILIRLKKEVPNKYALPIELRTKIIDDINRLLGVNSSETT